MEERTIKIERLITISIIALLIIGSIVIIFPFLRAILWAIVFAVTSWPLFLKAEKWFGGRAGFAALVPTLLIALIFFLPLTYAGTKVVTQAPLALDSIQALIEKGLGTPPQWLVSLPFIGGKLEAVWLDFDRFAPQLVAMIKPHVKTLLSYMISAGTSVLQFILITVLSLLFLFFVLKEGHAVRDSLMTMATKLAGEKGRHLMEVAGSTMRSVVNGILVTALVQGILAFIGLWVAGVPNSALLGTAAGLFALVPVGLIQLILLPSAGWLLFTGQTGWGIFLLIWSLVIVGNIDQVLRPMLISRGANVPFMVVLLGVLGGLAVGGFIGLFVGATVLSVFFTMYREWVAEPMEDASGEERS